MKYLTTLILILWLIQPCLADRTNQPENDDIHSEAPKARLANLNEGDWSKLTSALESGKVNDFSPFIGQLFTFRGLLKEHKSNFVSVEVSPDISAKVELSAHAVENLDLLLTRYNFNELETEVIGELTKVDQNPLLITIRATRTRFIIPD